MLPIRGEPPPLRVLILAQIPLIREGLYALLAQERELDVTALAPSDDMLEEIAAAEPHVLLVDVQVLEREGWELLNDVRRDLPGLTILILGEAAQDRRVPQALNMGVRGYLLRDSSADELANAVRAAARGTIVLHPQIVAALLDRLNQDQAARERAEDPSPVQDLIEPLSERELDVLRLITRGLSNKQIASELYITEHTVKFHIRAILGKLGAANRTEAVTLALQKGLVSL